MIPLLALLTGCFRDELDQGYGKGEGVTLRVAFDIPEARETRSAIGDLPAGQQVGSLWVMVFSENGLYVSRHEGVAAEDDGDYTFDGITITNSARILHFVANYDWSGFRDVDNINLSENEIVTDMSVAEGTVAYWQRVVAPAGTFNGAIPNPTLPGGTVHLVRNVAQVTVVNNTDQSQGTYLTDVKFSIGARWSKGTVAPYRNTEPYGFGGGNRPGNAGGDDVPGADGPEFVMQARDGARIVGVAGFPYVDVPDDGTRSGAKYIFERKNTASTAEDPPTCVIISALYHDGVTTPTTRSYYKINIVDDEEADLLDIQRNWQYAITINSVSADGQESEEEAVQRNASNNIAASTVAREFTSISDGQDVLTVEGTDFTYTEANHNFRIRYSYLVGGTTVDNSDVEYSYRLLDNSGDVVQGGEEGITIDNGANGSISATTAATLPVNRVYTAEITISKGNLSRTIIVHLRQPMTITIVSPTPRGSVGNAINQPADIVFHFPIDASQSLFPVPVRIYTNKLTPVPGSGMTIETGGGRFWYVFNAPYVAPGAEYTLNFVSNSTNTNEIVRLEADRFTPAYVRFGNFTFTNVAMSAPRRMANAPVDIDFTIPVDYWAENDECVVTFDVTNLEPRGNDSGLTTVNGDYELRVTQADGETMTRAAGDVHFTARFQTTPDTGGTSTTSNPSATIGATGFDNATISATRINWDFIDARFTRNNNGAWTTDNAKPRELGTNNASMDVDVRVNFNIPEGSTPVTVRFNAPYLEQRTGETSAGITVSANGGNVSGRIYTITVDTPGDHYFTVYKSRRQANNDAMTLTATGFNESVNLNAQ